MQKRADLNEWGTSLIQMRTEEKRRLGIFNKVRGLTAMKMRSSATVTKNESAKKRDAAQCGLWRHMEENKLY